MEVIGVNFGEAAEDKKSYANARAEMYFEFADAVKNGFYVSSEAAREELTHTTYLKTKTGKIQLIEKDEIKALIGRSPDTADSLCLAWYKRKNIKAHADARQVAAAFLKAFGH